MSKIWIVVADEAKARVLQTDKSTSPLVEIKNLKSMEGSLARHDLVTDKAGRSFDSSGMGRHAMGSEDNPKKQYAINFAKDLAECLEKDRQHKVFKKLIIIAAPRFLGILRKQLSQGVSDLVSLEIDKDLTMVDLQRIREHLPQYL